MKSEILDYLNSFGKDYDFNFLRNGFVKIPENYKHLQGVEGKRVLFTDYFEYYALSSPNNIGSEKPEKIYLADIEGNEKIELTSRSHEFSYHEESGNVFMEGDFRRIKDFVKYRSFYLETWGMFYHQEFNIVKVRNENKYVLNLTSEYLRVPDGDYFKREVKKGTWEILSDFGNQIDFENKPKMTNYELITIIKLDDMSRRSLTEVITSKIDISSKGSWDALGPSKALDIEVYDDKPPVSEELLIPIALNNRYGFRVLEASFNCDKYGNVHSVRYKEVERIILKEEGAATVYKRSDGFVSEEGVPDRCNRSNYCLKIPPSFDFISEGVIDLKGFIEEIEDKGSKLYSMTYLKYFIKYIEVWNIKKDPIRLIDLIHKFPKTGLSEWFLYHESKYTVHKYMSQFGLNLEDFISSRYSCERKDSPKNYYEAVGLNSYQFEIVNKSGILNSRFNYISNVRYILTSSLDGDIRDCDNKTFDQVFEMVSGWKEGIMLFSDESYLHDIGVVISLLKDLNVPLKTILNKRHALENIFLDMDEYMYEPGSLITYRDYLQMLAMADKDISSRFEIFPNNNEELVAYHDNLTFIVNSENSILREGEFKEVKHEYDRLNYDVDSYQVRGPETLNELIKEGVVLNHCVASYVDMVASGKRKVLFIRNKDKPSLPFYTVELSIDDRIVQVKGTHNKMPSADVKDFVYKWAKDKELKFSGF